MPDLDRFELAHDDAQVDFFEGADDSDIRIIALEAELPGTGKDVLEVIED